MRKPVLAAAAAPAAVLALVVFWRPTGVVAVEPAPEGFAEALAVHGTLFKPASDPVVAARAAAVTASAALDTALKEFGSASGGTAHVYLGTLTVENLHEGDAGTPLLIENRRAFAVQVTGVQVPPLGMPATEESLHEELVIFIDAVSGEFLFASTVR